MAKECINCGRKIGFISGEHFDGLLCDNCYNEFGGMTLINENHGTIDKQEMMRILSEHTKNGWKLHTIYSNELGKNALGILGLGINATACEDVLIFERRVKEPD